MRITKLARVYCATLVVALLVSLATAAAASGRKRYRTVNAAVRGGFAKAVTARLRAAGSDATVKTRRIKITDQWGSSQRHKARVEIDDQIFSGWVTAIEHPTANSGYSFNMDTINLSRFDANKAIDRGKIPGSERKLRNYTDAAYRSMDKAAAAVAYQAVMASPQGRRTLEQLGIKSKDFGTKHLTFKRVGRSATGQHRYIQVSSKKNGTDGAPMFQMDVAVRAFGSNRAWRGYNPQSALGDLAINL